jgi:parallel beta-helix repeat protein
VHAFKAFNRREKRMMKKMSGLCAGVVFCFLLFCNAEAAVFNVTTTAELQGALTAAQGNGTPDIINLAPGTYAVDSPLQYVAEEPEDYSLTIQGAGAGTTILDGGGSTSILQIEQGFLSEGTNADVIIRGVTFQNGSESSGLGGALYIGNYYAQTIIEDSIFQDNTSVLGGGALYLSGWTTHLNRNTFTGNSSTDLNWVGGAVYAQVSGGTLSLVGNTFSDNSCAGSGAGLFATDSGPIVLTGNIFSNNVAGGEGGGGYISAEFGGSVTLSGNRFIGNSGTSSGGIFLASDTGPVLVSGNIFQRNLASISSQSNGGGLTVFSQNALTMVNNLLAENTTSGRGAGAFLNLYSNDNRITNNTFTGNHSTGAYGRANSQGGGMYVITGRNEAVLNIYNSIFWGNTAEAPSHTGADFYINDDGLDDGNGSMVNLYNSDYSDMAILRGNHFSQGGNINEDPAFDGEYRLTPGSPCMDTGNNGAPGLPGTDLAGAPRIQDGNETGTAIVDMGAYEWAPPAGALQVTITPPGAVAAGAKWRRMGTSAWLESDATEPGIPVGTYTVEFSDAVGWTAPGNESVTIEGGQTATLSVTYTLKPVYPAEGTIGTEFTITGSGFGIKKGKVLMGATSVSVLDWKNDSIRCRLGKAAPPGIYDVRVLPSTPKGSAPIVHKEAFGVKSPQMVSLSQDHGATGDRITVNGQFWGTQKGKVYLGYTVAGSPKTKSCSVQSWTMNPATGEGEIVFLVPKGLPPKAYDIRITNKVGSDIEPDRFTVD